MQSAALAERERIERELRKLDARQEAVTRELATLRSAQEELQAQLLILNRFAHGGSDYLAGNGKRSAAAPPTETFGLSPGGSEAVVLKGLQIRESAVRVLASSPEGRGPVHYRTWFELLRSRGFVPAGKNPLATFLTQLGRSPVVNRSTASGMYALDFGFPRRARRQLEKLRVELEATHELPVDAGVEAIAAARERRAELAKAVESTERALEEALRSLGDVSAGGVEGS